MAVRTWMLARIEPGVRAARVLAGAPVPDEVASRAVAAAWLRKKPKARSKYRPTGDLVALSELTEPDRKDAYLGVFPGVTIVVAADLGVSDPATLPEQFFEPSTVDAVTAAHWVDTGARRFAYATFGRTSLTRSLDVSAAKGIHSDIGARRDVEVPYWNGMHPSGADVALPFVPEEFAEAIRADLVGVRLDETTDPPPAEAAKLQLYRFVR